MLRELSLQYVCVSFFQGWGGIGSKVFLSLPCILGENGSTRLPGVSLGSEDEMKLRESVACQVNLFMQLRL